MERALRWQSRVLEKMWEESPRMCRLQWNPALGPSEFRREGVRVHLKFVNANHKSIQCQVTTKSVHIQSPMIRNPQPLKSLDEFLGWWRPWIHRRVQQGTLVMRIEIDLRGLPGSCPWMADQETFSGDMAEMAALFPLHGAWVIHVNRDQRDSWIALLRRMTQRDGGAWQMGESPHATQPSMITLSCWRVWEALGVQVAVVVTTYGRVDGSSPFLLGDTLARIPHQDHPHWSLFVMGDRYEPPEKFGRQIAEWTLPQCLKLSGRLFKHNLPVALERDHRPQLISQDLWCLGGAGTMNAGLREAHRRLVKKSTPSSSKVIVYCCLDDDDLWHPHHLSCLARAYAHPDCQPEAVTTRTWFEGWNQFIPPLPASRWGLTHRDNWRPAGKTSAHGAWNYRLDRILLPLRTMDDPVISKLPAGQKPPADADCLTRLGSLLDRRGSHSVALAATTLWHETEGSLGTPSNRRWWFRVAAKALQNPKNPRPLLSGEELTELGRFRVHFTLPQVIQHHQSHQVIVLGPFPLSSSSSSEVRRFVLSLSLLSEKEKVMMIIPLHLSLFADVFYFNPPPADLPLDRPHLCLILP